MNNQTEQENEINHKANMARNSGVCGDSRCLKCNKHGEYSYATICDNCLNVALGEMKHKAGFVQ